MRSLSAWSRSPALRLTGFAASLLAFAGFVYVLVDAASAADVKAVAERHSWALGAVLLLYGIAYVPMVQAWLLLARASGAETNGVALTRVFLVAQIGKYMPGNVAQFLGRAYLASAQGVPVKASVAAMALELAGVMSACAILALAAVALGSVGSSDVAHSVVLGATVAGAAVAALAAVLVLRSSAGTLPRLAGPFGAAVLLYILVLALLAAANIVLIGALSGQWSWGMAGAVSGALVVSWFVGFVTPGSPAGLGLRELTFLGLLSGSYADETLALAAAAFRLATVIGDILAWAAGMLLRKEAATAERPS